jgi:hypothetical protein
VCVAIRASAIVTATCSLWRWRRSSARLLAEMQGERELPPVRSEGSVDHHDAHDAAMTMTAGPTCTVSRAAA